MLTSSAAKDGRKARGDLTVQNLISATLAIIERDGLSGVTHRSVAQQAGVSPSSAIYYFATLDDLMLAALTSAAKDYAQQFQTLLAEGHDEIGAIAEMIAQSSGAGRQRAIAERELTLLAARRPALRAIANHWRDLVTQTISKQTNDALKIQTIVALTDGICAKALVDDSPVAAKTVRNLIEAALK